MIIHFCKSNTLSGLLIRLATFSKWNHVAIEIDGQVYDATGKFGVARWNKLKFLKLYDEISSRSVGGDEVKARKFLESQLGKTYDFGALFALPFRERWQDTGKWFCSELAATALIKAGRSKFRIRESRVTPRDLWLVL